MDLSVHAMKDERTWTIFEDAEYFSKGYSYKLMPITFESVNETIIHIEHNYCHWIQCDLPESNESHNSPINKEVEERNYKKRKIKSLALDDDSTGKGCETEAGESAGTLSPGSKCKEFLSDSQIDSDCGISAQPLDLSLPLLQEQKADKTLTENQSNIPKIKSDAKSSPDKKQLNLHESNKENVTSPSKKIEVTISRPGQKGYYEPCEVFLNDLAKISPDLIKNDCREIEIIDRTHSEDLQEELSRTYYIVLESTWRIFEDSTERIILTNDLNIGQPVQNNEKHDKPRYLIFDQYSLTESLSKICESKGGRFEYTCLEEQKEQPKIRDDGKQESVICCDDNNSDCLKSNDNIESESGRSGIRHFDKTDEGEKEKVLSDCASGSGNSNYVEKTLLENNDSKVEVDEAKTEKLHPGNSSRDEEFPDISKVPFVSEDGDATRLKNEGEICDCNSSTGPVESVESNLALSEPVNVSTESNEIDNKCNSGSSSVEGAIEHEKEEKCASDIGSVKTNSFSESELKGTKEARISNENSCAILGKINELNALVKVENVTENEKVQKDAENVGKRETTGEKLNSPFLSTLSRDAQPWGKVEAGKIGKEPTSYLPENRTDKEDSVKVARSGEIKGKSRGIKRKISSTDIKTRSSSKEVGALRNGKQRCAPPAKAATATTTTAKRGRMKMDSAKISKPKPERTEEILKIRARTGKTASEESKKICLRKRS